MTSATVLVVDRVHEVASLIYAYGVSCRVRANESGPISIQPLMAADLEFTPKTHVKKSNV